MGTSSKSLVLIFLAGFAATIMLPGCSQFRSSKYMDLTPFAENMIALAGDIQYGLAQQEVVYLRDYMDIPEIKDLNVYLDKMRAVMRGSIAYSIEVVTLSNSNLSGAEQCTELADYLDGLLRPVLEAPVPQLHFTIEDFDTLLDDARQQTSLLDALEVTQPIVNEVSRAMSEIIDDANIAVDDAAIAIRADLEKENASLIKSIRMIREYQQGTIMTLDYIAKYRRGEPEAFDTLLMFQPSLREVVSSTTRPTPADMAAVEQRLIFMLTTFHDIRAQMMPDLELYWKQQRELDELTKIYKSALRKAQVTMIAWSRAHQRLAAGMTDPAKIDVLGLAKKAAGAASPL